MNQTHPKKTQVFVSMSEAAPFDEEATSNTYPLSNDLSHYGRQDKQFHMKLWFISCLSVCRPPSQVNHLHISKSLMCILKVTFLKELKR